MVRLFILLLDCVSSSKSLWYHEQVFVQLHFDTIYCFALWDENRLFKSQLHFNLRRSDADHLKRHRLLFFFWILNKNDIKILHRQVTVIFLQDDCLIHLQSHQAEVGNALHFATSVSSNSYLWDVGNDRSLVLRGESHFKVNHFIRSPSKVRTLLFFVFLITLILSFTLCRGFIFLLCHWFNDLVRLRQCHICYNLLFLCKHEHIEEVDRISHDCVISQWSL